MFARNTSIKNIYQDLNSHHYLDKNDNPEGGCSYGPGFCISWQNGPLERGEDRQEPNGAAVEDVIAAAINRLEFYEKYTRGCTENRSAIRMLYFAIDFLNERTARVEGTRD